MKRLPDAGRPVVGWDIGGAHVKAALCANGRVRAVVQRPCPLWQGLAHLDRALDDVLGMRAFDVDARHAVTMTGEMADCFADRRQGVSTIASHAHRRLGADTRFFAGADWCAAAEAVEQWQRIASANWLATATWVASSCADALVVDVGSTTTDVVPIVGGRVAAHGRDDASRLASRELVYHGVVRTPLAALAQRIAFGGREYNVMNEWFATTADVYRLTGELAAEHDQHPPADGGSDKSERATCARVARMIGQDAAAAPIGEWRAFAHAWRALQLGEIERNLNDVIDGAALSRDAVIVGAGCGDFLARDLAARTGRRYVAFDALIDAEDACAPWARVCAPSVAIAALFEREGERVDRQARRQPRD